MYWQRCFQRSATESPEFNRLDSAGSVELGTSLSTEVLNTISRALQLQQINELGVVINCRDELKTPWNRLGVGLHITAPPQCPRVSLCLSNGSDNRG
jgi:hypothetical protein